MKWMKRKNRQDLRALRETFPNVPEEMVNAIYDLMYTTGAGFLATFDEHETFEELLISFSEFAERAAIICSEPLSVREKRRALEDNPSADVLNWVRFYDC